MKGSGIREQRSGKAWRLGVLCALVMGLSATGARATVPHDWPDTVAQMGCSNVAAVYRFMDSASPFADWLPTPCGSAPAYSLTASGTVTYQQAGYDATSSYGQTANAITNGAATFAPSAKGVASSSTLGNLSFRSAGAVEVIFKTSSLPSSCSSNTEYSLAAKGSGISTVWNVYAGSNGWGVYAECQGNAWYPAFAVNASGNSTAGGAGDTSCLIYFTTTTPSTTAYLQNGYWYDYVVSWDGSAQCNSSHYTATLNGYTLSGGGVTISNQASFTGITKTTVTAGGSGYLSGGSGTFAVTYTGGGCSTEPTGLANVTSGAVTSVTNSNAYVFGVGCTSAPTPVFTAGGGSGATGTTTLNLYDITNTGYLEVGDFSSSSYASGMTVSVAGLAVYPNGITAGQIAQHFAALDWYRALLPTKPATPTPVVVTDDFCSDTDGEELFWALQRLSQMGYVNLLAVVDTEGSTYGPQYMAYALARGGQGQVPLLQSTNSETDNAYCGPVLTAITKAPSISRSSYATPNTTLCTLLAAQSNGSVVVLDGGGLTMAANLMQATNCGASGQSGATLMGQKLYGYYDQGGAVGSSGSGGFNWGTDTTSSAYVLANWNNIAPFYENAITGFANATGTCSVYNSNSIEYQTWSNFGGTCSLDSRTAWDAYMLLQWMFPSWWTVSANGKFTYTSSGNTYTWSSGTANNQFYTSALSGNNLIAGSFLTSLLWSDPALHGLR